MNDYIVLGSELLIHQEEKHTQLQARPCDEHYSKKEFIDDVWIDLKAELI